MAETARLGLPLLSAGQAQKEVTHNEALAAIDTIVHPLIQAMDVIAPPPAPTLGQAWIVGEGATGAWAGHDGTIAGWTTGGWRFLIAPEGTTGWLVASDLPVRRTASGWIAGDLGGSSVSVGGQTVVGARGAAIGDPTGGTTIDAAARTAIAAVLQRLRAHGLIAS
ncbi:DUF2793 domain-containing protein [Sphingomonas sp. ID0503]|uniref:DUF2793 domain-containing protein n=1 Tax=Sphingomonas sp. ID0503 TaxID=3399691 RepID=UPI003AFA7F64